MPQFTKDDPRINRKGRPKKGQSLTDILQWALDQKKTVKNKTSGEIREVLARQLLAEKVVDLAINGRGDIQAIKYIMDRIDGKPIETIRSATVTDDITNLTSEERDKRIEELLNGGHKKPASDTQ